MINTIYALSTILGRSGVAVIRISGKRAKDVLYAFTNKTSFISRNATLCTIFSPTTGEILDKIIAIYFEAPNTFTGEEIVEFHLHGSIAVIKDVLYELSQIRFIRCAEPGEFTRQAFENGKMNLVEVEAFGELIHSETTSQRRAAIHQISGHLTALYSEWRNEMIEIMAQFEAYIDFPEDDIPHTAIHFAMQKIEVLKNSIRHTLMISEKAIPMINGIFIAIGGPPNAGKSSIMNLLSKQEISIVSEIAGTTRDIVQVKMEINGVNVTICDTAGIRENTNDIIEQEGIRRAKFALESADIQIYVFDATNISDIQHFTIPQNAIVLLNKCDKIQNADELSQYGMLFSAKSAYNIQNLLQKLHEIIENRCSISMNETIITQQRQKEKLLECLTYLDVIDTSEPLEITAQKIRSAVSNIEYITGKITLDDVLDKIFSTFCIGK